MTSAIRQVNSIPEGPALFEPSNRWRIVKEKVLRFVQDIWITLVDWSLRSNLKGDPKKGSKYYSLARCLQSRSKLSTSLFSFLTSEKETATNKFFFGHSFIVPNKEMEELPELPYGSYLAIPVVLEGSLGCDHIVCFYVDPSQQTLEFFDSKGLTVLDRGNDRVREINTTLSRLAGQICEKYHLTTVKENKQKIQKDCYNCGVFVWDFIERRMNRESWEKIQQKPLRDTDGRRSAFMGEIAALPDTTEPSYVSSADDEF